MSACWRCLVASAALVALCLASGCQGQAAPASQTKSRQDLKTLVIFYHKFLTYSGGRPPKDVEEFKKYVREAYPSQAAALGDFDPEKSFVSDRDHQPWEWVFKPPKNASGGSTARLVVYEKSGVDGKHMAGMSNMMVLELDDAELKQYLAPATGG